MDLWEVTKEVGRHPFKVECHRGVTGFSVMTTYPNRKGGSVRITDPVAAQAVVEAWNGEGDIEDLFPPEPLAVAPVTEEAPVVPGPEPCPSCGKNYVHLQRHIEKVHGE